MNRLAHWLDVAIGDDAVLVRVTGLGDMRLASLLNDLAEHWLSEKPRDMVIGLAHCIGLDSTFMGTLLRLSEITTSQRRILHLCNVTPECRKCLETLGVDRLLRIEDDRPMPELRMERLKPEPASHARQIQLIHAAHARLAAANTENRERFGLFLQTLEREMRMHPEDVIEIEEMAEAEDVDTSEIDPT